MVVLDIFFLGLEIQITKSSTNIYIFILSSVLDVDQEYKKIFFFS